MSNEEEIQQPENNPEIIGNPILEATILENSTTNTNEEQVVENPVTMDDLMAPPTSQPEVSPVVPAFVDKPKKKKNSKLIIAIISVILVVVGIVGYFYLVSRNEKMILSRSVEQLQRFISNQINFNFEIPKIKEFSDIGNISYEISSGETDDEIVSMLLDILNQFKVDYEIEVRNDSLYFGMDLLDNDGEVLNFQFEGRNNNIYVSIKQLFSKVVTADFNTDILLNDDQVTFDDLKYLYDFILLRTVTNMDSSYFEKEPATITLDGTEVRTTKTTVALDNQKLVGLFNKVLNDIREDEEAYGILKKLLDDFYDEEFKFTEAEYTSDEIFKYSVYTSGFFNKVVGIDFEFASEFSQDIIEYRAEKHDTIYIRNKYVAMGDTIIDDVFKIVFMHEKNQLTISIYNNEEKAGTVLIRNLASNHMSIEITIDSEDEMKITFEMKIDEISKGKEYNYMVNINFIQKEDNIVTFEMDIRSTGVIKDISATEFSSKIDKSNLMNFNDFSFEYLEEISENLMEILFKYIDLEDLFSETW